MNTTNTEISVARTIYNQIGGRRFMLMVGGKDVFSLNDNNTLKFSFGRNRTKANRCEITYDAGKDLYKMRFIYHSFSKKTYTISEKILKEYDGVYCDQLESLFSEFTGMATRL